MGRHDPPRAAAHGDAFTPMLATSHPYNFFAFGDTPILIEDPEGNKVRSLGKNPLSIISVSVSPRYPTVYHVPLFGASVAHVP